MNAVKNRSLASHCGRLLRIFASLSVFICVHLWLVSCSSKPTDPRTVVPADSLIYLETQDLGKALRAVTEAEAFKNAAATQPNLSPVDGIRLGIAVTGFEGSRQDLNEEQAVGTVTPRFVAVAETNAWNYQAVSFAENQFGEFINDIYGGEVELVTSQKHDGKYLVWTAQDGRKAFGLVIGSLIFFGNDESAIEKCVAVRGGQAESIAANPKLPPADSLAGGYVAPDGVAQIANIATLQLAIGAGEEEEVRGFIARVLPEIIRKSVTDASWRARKTEQGIEDSYTFTTAPEVGKVLSETIRRGEGTPDIPEQFIPADVISATRYDLADPQVAWRSIVLTAQNQTDGLSGGVIGAFSGALFESYGVEKPEEFLAAVGRTIVTLRFDEEGEEVIAIATAKDLAKVKAALAQEIKLSAKPERLDGADVWRSEDGDLMFAVAGDKVLVGHAESVQKCLRTAATNQNTGFRERFLAASNSPTPAVTVASDTDPSAALVTVISARKSETEPLVQRFQINTSFTPNAIQRVEVSDFGLIGSIIEQFAK
jgi:hypothetical protein